MPLRGAGSRSVSFEARYDFQAGLCICTVA
jgi:hypothetical protein